MSIIEGVQSHYRLFGYHGILAATKARLSSRPQTITVSTSGIRHPIHLRLRTSDISLFEEIILNNEYRIDISKTPHTIIDAGANIGMASIYYANKYPNAKIIAIEPELSNFNVLKTNANPYKNIFPVLGALWKEDTMLCLSDPGTGKWGFQTRNKENLDKEDNNVFGFTINSLMDKYGLDYIDILKVDIEGSEKEVFEDPVSWINKVGVIVIELHERSKNGCTRSVYNATQNFAYDFQRGETTFFVRNEYALDRPLLESVLTPPINSLPMEERRKVRARIMALT